jgi:heme-degrading monooxygenase HmoA
MARVWTYGTWVVKPGSEPGFVDAWSRLARAAILTFESERPVLLRDRDRPNTFTTFGAWPSLEAIDAFRASDLFRDSVAELQPLLESFEPMTLDEVDWA